MTKREKILHTAMCLFVEKGVQSTSTASIAKEAGVATGTLFHHFKSKEELLHELYNLIFDSLIKFHHQNFKEDSDAYTNLRQLWSLNIEWGMQNVEYANFLERYAFHFYASNSAVQDAGSRFDYYLKIIADLIEANLTKCNDFEYVMNHFSWNMRMNGNYLIAHPELYSPEMVERTFQIYWSGISKSPLDNTKK